MLPALLKDKFEEYNFITIIAQDVLKAPPFFFQDPPFSSLIFPNCIKITLSHITVFAFTFICNFSVAIIVSQITGAHNLRKNTANVGKNNSVSLRLKPGNDATFGY